MNELLARQIKKYFGMAPVPEQFAALFDAVSRAYDGFESDRRLMERAFDLSSQEITEANDKLRREISERMAAQDIMLEMMLRFEAIIDNSPMVAIQGFDRDGVVHRWNPASEKLYGYTAKEAIGMHIRELLKETDAPVLEQNIRRVWDTGKPLVPCECMIRTRGGEERWVYSTMFPVFDRGGNIIEVYCMDVDITERKTAEKALRESEQVYKGLVENVNDIVFRMSDTGMIEYVNSVVYKLYGYGEGELVGKHMKTTMPIGDLPEALRMLKIVLSGKPVKEAQIRQLTKGGEVRLFEINAVPIFRDNKVVAVQGVMRDITERKKVEQAQRLVELGKLVSDMGHEVNNPLMIISGRAQLVLEQDIKNDKIRRDIEVIVDQCRRAKEVIQRLLMFSKPSGGVFKKEDINKVIQEVVDIVEYQFSLSNIHIEKIFNKTLPLVKIDKKMIQEAFLNFFNNSRDAMPTGGDIRIITGMEKGFVKIEFKDTGCGMSEETLKKVCDPFYTTKESGVGLGLSVVFGTVKAHEGDLRFESEEGKGTSVIVLLPPAEKVKSEDR